jgi:hypothetical protein
MKQQKRRERRVVQPTDHFCWGLSKLDGSMSKLDGSMTTIMVGP